jgi:hypothetical protein
VALAGALWTLWDRREHDPWLRLLHRVHKRLAAGGVALPPAAPPRQIATVLTERFGDTAAGLADWLLKLESQRYARTSGVNLAGLRRELKGIPWPV